jgi:hypothetical protein
MFIASFTSLASRTMQLSQLRYMWVGSCGYVDYCKKLLWSRLPIIPVLATGFSSVFARGNNVLLFSIPDLRPFSIEDKSKSKKYQ